MRAKQLFVFPFLLISAVVAADVPSYMVYCSEEQFQYMNSNWQEEIEIDCTVARGDTLYTGCRMRIRGDSSRQFPKKSYRITFSNMDPLDGRSKWNFNAEYLDHTYMHTWLFSRILHELDYPCFDVDYGRLYVNDQYRGLYIRCEPIDELFLLGNGLDPNGNLYKAALDGSCLSVWDDVDSVWDKRTNEEEGWNDLYQLIEDLEVVSADSIVQLTGEYFNISDLMTMISVNYLTSNTSTYYHNYFLYHDIWTSGKWLMLPWDVDKTFIQVGWTYWMTNNEHWFDNPLHRKLILDSVYLDMLFQRMDNICATVFNNTVLDPMIDSLKIELADAVDEDTRDDTDLNEFLAGADSIITWFIPGRMPALRYEYDHTCRPFASSRGDSSGCEGHFVSWQSAIHPEGDPITYTVTVSTDIWDPDSVVTVYEGLTDTCLIITGLDPGSYYWKVHVPDGWRKTEAYDRCNRFEIETGTELSGTLSGTTILSSAGSPYLVTGDITIPDGSHLLIESGTELRFCEDVRLTCDGKLSCNGAPGDSVMLCADVESKPWAGILLTGQQKSILKFTVISGSIGYYEAPIQYYSSLCGFDTDLELLNCSFRDNNCCIRLIGGQVVVLDCDFSGGNSGELFIMENGIGALIENSSFGNLINSSTEIYDAVEFVHCFTGDFIVNNCHIWNIDGDGIDSNGSNLSCSGNLIHDIEDKGISLGTCSGGIGISFYAELTNNIVHSCEIGIGIKDGAVAEIDRCTVTDCATAISLYEKTPGFGGGEAVLQSSVLYGNSVLVQIDDLSTVSIKYSLTGSEEAWPGTGNISGNPIFMNYPENDFHLQFISPCIDSGNPDDTDPDGTRADMGAIFFPQVFDQLCINELQSSNRTTVKDSWGEYGDWLEICNNSDWDCDLSWAYLSDDPSDPGKWRFPSGTVAPAGGFLLVWADGDYWKQGLHLPWRLSASGDSLYLSAAVVQGSKETLKFIDDITFGNIGSDLSFGRLPDGGAVWQVLETPTPGASNGSPGPFPGTLIAGHPFPNPCSGSMLSLDLKIDQGWTDISVYDLAGRLVRVIASSQMSEGEHRICWDLMTAGGSRVPAGIYFILIEHAGAIPVSGKVVVLTQQ